MGGGDLDGDMYLVITDKKLVPPPSVERSKVEPISRVTSSPPVSSAAASSSGPRTRNQKAELEEKLRVGSIATFVELTDDPPLGRLANEWLVEAQLTPELTHSPVCRELRALIERALDMTKSGSKPGAIMGTYHSIVKTKLSNMRQDRSWISPLAILEAMVPQNPSSKQTDFTCDPDLVYKDRVPPEVWEAALKEAWALLPEYNKGISEAIRFDESRVSSQGKASASSKRDEVGESNADRFKRQFMERHFPATGDIFQLAHQVVKASAWYGLSLDCYWVLIHRLSLLSLGIL
jgi:RNA-dependent RNA polymerase